MDLFGIGYGAIGRSRVCSGSRSITVIRGFWRWQSRFADTMGVVRVPEAPCRSK